MAVHWEGLALLVENDEYPKDQNEMRSIEVVHGNACVLILHLNSVKSCKIKVLQTLQHIKKLTKSKLLNYLFQISYRVFLILIIMDTVEIKHHHLAMHHLRKNKNNLIFTFQLHIQFNFLTIHKMMERDRWEGIFIDYKVYYNKGMGIKTV